MKIAILSLIALVGIGVLVAAIWAYTPDKPRGEIEAAYHIAPGDYRDIAGLRLRMRDEGRRQTDLRDAPAVILLHGFGASLETWDDWAAALAKDFRVVRFDWPGFGLSGRDPNTNYSDARSLVVLDALMQTLGIARASLIGHSLGGKLAWMFAAQHPDKLNKLVLVSPDGFASPGFAYGQKPNVPWTARLLPYVLPTPLVRMSVAPAFADPSKLSEALVTRYRDFLLAPGIRSAMLARMAQVHLDQPEPLLRRIKTPTLLVWGDKDRMIPFANAQDYLRVMPNAQLVPLPGVGHVPQEEAPETALKPVRGFLVGE